MSRFLRERFRNLEPYVPGEQPQDRKYLKLNTNESPYPPSPAVLAAKNKEENLQLYPDPDARQLTEVLAEKYNVSPNQIFAGNGSDEVLALIFQAFCDHEHEICYPDLTYGFYPVFSAFCGLKKYEIPLKADFTIDSRDYDSCGKHVLLANPNAPSGLCLKKGEIKNILRTNPDHLVIIDEAYIDFDGESSVPLIKKYDNLIVVQTFSKSRSLAGARIGYAIASEELIADLKKIKFSFNPYNINRLSMNVGKAAVLDEEYYSTCCRELIQTREKTKQALRDLNFAVTDSKANFLFVKPSGIGGEEFYLALKKRGILVRHFDIPRITDYVRISIGTPSQMDCFLEETKKILDEQRGQVTKR